MYLVKIEQNTRTNNQDYLLCDRCKIKRTTYLRTLINIESQILFTNERQDRKSGEPVSFIYKERL